MLEDLAFSVGRQPLLADVKVVVPPATSRQGKRRPPARPHAGQTVLSPINRTSSDDQPAEGFAAETAPVKDAYFCKVRPRSLGPVPWQTTDTQKFAGIDGVSPIATATSAEVIRLQGIVAELTAKCEQQDQELQQLRLQASAAKHTSGAQLQADGDRRGKVATSTSSTLTEREVQTDDTELLALQRQQLEAMHREAAMKSREMRRIQETVHTLRAELNQQRRFADQYKEQVDLLEAQLMDATQKQQRAEDEKAVAEWRLRSAESAGRTSRSCTPGPCASARVIKAWSEASCVGPGGGDSEAEHATTLQHPRSARALGRSTTPLWDHRMRKAQLGEDSDDGTEEVSQESDGEEEITVYHPPTTSARRMIPQGGRA